MVAQVFSFLKAKTKFAPATDWSTQEIAEFYRVEASLIQAGMSVSGDRGVTDEGDPWFVFCRPSDGEVIIHFARIGGDYLIVSESTGQTLRGPDFRRLLSEFSAINPTLVPLRKAEASAKLFIHPAALLAAVVAAAFFEFSKSEAVASEFNADGHDEQASSRHSTAHEMQAPHVSDVVFDPERRQSDRQVVAAMAAMIGLAALELAPVGNGHAIGSASALLDVSSDTFHQPKIAGSQLAANEHVADRAPSDNLFSLSLPSPSVFSQAAVTNNIDSRELPHFVSPVHHSDEFIASAARDVSIIVPQDRSDVPIFAFTSADGLQFILPLTKFAYPKAGTASLIGTVADTTSAGNSLPDSASAALEHASSTIKVSQPMALDIVNSDVSATTRSVTVTILRTDLTLPNVIEYAASHTFGDNFAYASLIDLNIHTSHIKGDIAAIDLQSSTISATTGNALSSMTTSDGSISLTTSSASPSSAASSAVPAAAAPPGDATSARTTYDTFDASAKRLLMSFIAGNQTEIFSTGRDVVVVDIENHHDYVNDIFIKSWSTTDGSTISIIGHAAHVDLALM